MSPPDNLSSPPSVTAVKRMLLMVLTVGLVLAACGDDTYSAPERSIDFRDDVLEASGVSGVLQFDRDFYVDAYETVAEVNSLDPTDPLVLLDGSEPRPFIADGIAACAWAAALADGSEADEPAVAALDGFGPLRDELLERTNGGDCGTLSEDDFSRFIRDLPVPDAAAERALEADRYLIEYAIARALAPEIAEAVAD